MSGRSRRTYHVRAYLGSDLYERILREAAVRRVSVSECVREDLEELHAIRDQLSRPLEVEQGDGSSGARVTHRIFGEMEARLVAGLSRQLDELISLAKVLGRIEAMIDRQYVGLMLHLPDLQDRDAHLRSASALRRYQAWRRAVEERLLEASDERT